MRIQFLGTKPGILLKRRKSLFHAPGLVKVEPYRIVQPRRTWIQLEPGLKSLDSAVRALILDKPGAQLSIRIGIRIGADPGLQLGWTNARCRPCERGY